MAQDELKLIQKQTEQGICTQHKEINSLIEDLDNIKDENLEEEDQ